jgi:glucokinase
MGNQRKILLDVGGTFIKCSDGRSIPVDSNGSREEIISSFKEAVGDLSTVDKVAVAIPGPFDYENGIFMMKHKYAAVYGERFSELVDAPASVEFAFIHDVNCMLLGEICHGNAKGYSSAAIVAIGTGLGFSISIDGAILKNPQGSPLVSIWNLPYSDRTVEEYVSKRGITGLYDANTDLSVKEIADLTYASDAKALKVFEQAGEILAEVLKPILEKYKIECLLFGGQISRSFELMRHSLEKKLAGLPALGKITQISDFENATFNGLSDL